MRMCSIYFSRGGSIASPEEDLTELRKWAVDRLVRLRDRVRAAAGESDA